MFEVFKGCFKVVGRVGVGIDNVDLEVVIELGCLVVNVLIVNIVVVVEYGIVFFMVMVCNVVLLDMFMKSGKWECNKYVGVLLVDKMLVIMGFGKVGFEVVCRVKGLGMYVIFYDFYVLVDCVCVIGVEFVSFDEVVLWVDFILLYMLFIIIMNKIFNDEIFVNCKKGVWIVNVVCGGVIDEFVLLCVLDVGVVV